MEIEIGQLAGLLGGELTDPSQANVKVSGARAIETAGEGDLAFLWDEKYRKAAETCKASVIIVQEAIPGRTCILVEDPQAAMLMILGQVYDTLQPPIPAEVHPTAYVSPEATLGEGVAVGPGAVIEDGATVGAGTQVRARAYIGRNVKVGERCTIHPNATVLDHTVMGDRVIVWSGAIIGKDGFGFLQREGRHVRVPQIGKVVIGDDVEVGALSTIARGALEDTVIGEGVVFDDHCHVAHGCEIGEFTVLVGRTAMGGSVKVGRHCFLLQDAGISTGIKIGDGAVIGSCARVFYKDVPAGVRVSIPANTHPHRTTLRIESILGKLPEMHKRLRKLERRLDALSGEAPA